MAPVAERPVILRTALATAFDHRDDVVGFPPALLAVDRPAMSSHLRFPRFPGASNPRLPVAPPIRTEKIRNVEPFRVPRLKAASARFQSMNSVPIPIARGPLRSPSRPFGVGPAQSADSAIPFLKLHPNEPGRVRPHPAVNAFLRVPRSPTLPRRQPAPARANDPPFHVPFPLRRFSPYGAHASGSPVLPALSPAGLALFRASIDGKRFGLPAR